MQRLEVSGAVRLLQWSFGVIGLSASSTYGERRGAYRVLVGKPGGKRPLRRTWRRWEDAVHMGRQELGWGHVVDLSDPG